MEILKHRQQRHLHLGENAACIHRKLQHHKIPSTASVRLSVDASMPATAKAIQQGQRYDHSVGGGASQI